MKWDTLVAEESDSVLSVNVCTSEQINSSLAAILDLIDWLSIKVLNWLVDDQFKYLDTSRIVDYFNDWLIENVAG